MSNQNSKQFIMEFTFKDGNVVKYIVNRKNYYEAKDEAREIASELNADVYVKESK